MLCRTCSSNGFLKSGSHSRRIRTGLGAESSGEYPLFEDVVREYMLRILLSQQDEKALTRLFGFFEKMARSSDPGVTNLLRLTILRPLVYKPE
jgi:hypothetical protein